MEITGDSLVVREMKQLRRERDEEFFGCEIRPHPSICVEVARKFVTSGIGTSRNVHVHRNS
jgi:hypothetical protein